MDVWYFEGDGAVTVDDFNGGDILAGSITYDTDANMTFTIDQWVEIDVTQLINARKGDDIYFNIRLSGGYQEGGRNSVK